MANIELTLLWIIQLAPMAAFLFIQLLPASVRRVAPLVGIVGAIAAAVASLLLLGIRLDHHEATPYIYRWLEISEGSFLTVGFLPDQLNVMMISLVTVIASFVQIFSYYYMADDASRSRYFGFLSFFAFSMTGLVLSSNLLQTFMFWELVGLTSYLLVGFWYEKTSAATAARKAFVINRLADLGFYLGLILLFLSIGSLEFTDLNAGARALPAGVAMISGLLVFMGVMGKSAQFPFHAWLPDAMEGPTPVSALIHSATMVAAGVFLLVRAYGLFSASETVLSFILITGCVTALVGATLALVQRDIKKIMAYSTISQLGFMVMAVGAHAPAAGMFHLSTHAFFKSLLFLTAGAFIHRFHSNDIWDIARGGGKKDLLAMAVLVIGLFSLVGIPPFAGFFSKDLILEALKHDNRLVYGLALLASFLTAFYSFRLLFILLFAKPLAAKSHGKAPAHAHDAHAHHVSPLLNISRAIPLVSLAALSLFMGALGTPLTGHAVLHWLLPAGRQAAAHAAPLDWEIVGSTAALTLIAAIMAFVRFRDPDAAERRLESAKGPLVTALKNKWYVDHVYEFLTRRVGLGIASAFDWFDRKFVNGILVNATSFRILDAGKIISKLQSGIAQDYLALAVGAGILATFFLTGLQ